MQEINVRAVDGEALPTKLITRVIFIQLRQSLLKLRRYRGDRHSLKNLRWMKTCKIAEWYFAHSPQKSVWGTHVFRVVVGFAGTAEEFPPQEIPVVLQEGQVEVSEELHVFVLDVQFLRRVPVNHLNIQRIIRVMWHPYPIHVYVVFLFKKRFWMTRQNKIKIYRQFETNFSFTVYDS